MNLINQSLQQLIKSGTLSPDAKLIENLPSDTNECWLVSDECPDFRSFESDNSSSLWVVKYLRTDELSVDREALIDNTTQAQQQGLTPPLVYSCVSSGCLIFPYRSASNLSESDWSMERKLELTARTLAKIHDAPMTFEPMDLYQEVEHYLHLLESVSDQTHYLSKVAQLPPLPETNYFAKGDAYCPCHMDLSFENLLTNGEVLDWEYARQALPLVDLASCASINQLSGSHAMQLFRRYCEARGGTASMEHFNIYCAWSNLLNEIWYRVAEQNTARKFEE